MTTVVTVVVYFVVAGIVAWGVGDLFKSNRHDDDGYDYDYD